MANSQVIKVKQELKIATLKRGDIYRFQLELSDNSLGVPWKIPLVVIRGIKKGPVVGITAAIHGDELNGISTIFKLIDYLDPKELKGTLILVPIGNVPGYLMNQRFFSDNVDLNRIMPGKVGGNSSSLYAHLFTSKIISKFDYLLDLHTASHGRVNSLYIRADLESEQTRTLAYLQNPQIIVQKYDESGTLRAWANEKNIPAITIEIGNPNAFQHNLIDETLDGIVNTLRHLKMLSGQVKDMVTDAYICDHSYWIYSKNGGIVDVNVKLADKVKKGQCIAKVFNVFGQIKEEVLADRDGIVIGKNVNPNCEAGTRIVHLGVNLIDPLPEDIPGSDEFNS
ncbi:MAG: M14 family metallopeptidase [Bacteriovoracaceae bacterium]|jgi:predicted deacylase|nr:M14 family metallopeptidase [Bacteriovoracaceae bacterium]